MFSSMEDYDYVPTEAKDFYKTYVKAGALSPKIVENLEIQEEDSKSTSFTESTSKHVVLNDVYVAVGKDDTDVVKWTLENAASPGSTRVFLVHVFPPIIHIPTPVGRLAKSQLNEDQVRIYVNEESNKRSNLLQKYVNLCNDAKVTAETMLLEGNCTEKLILDLIRVLSITHLVIGTKGQSRQAKKQLSLVEFVKNNAPDFCEVSIVHKGKKVEVNQQVNGPTTPENTRHFEKSLLFSCFPDSSGEGQDFLISSTAKSCDRDETNSAMHYGQREGHILRDDEMGNSKASQLKMHYSYCHVSQQ